VSVHGDVSFGDSTTAGSAAFTVLSGGSVSFGTNSSADHAVGTFSGAPGIVGSGISFTQSATAAEGQFTGDGATTTSDSGSFIDFSDTATAADATFIINGGTVQGAAGSVMAFSLSASAGNAAITVNGGTVGGEGGTLLFTEQSSGGTASLSLFANGQMDLSGHDRTASLTIGSLEGDGLVFLGSRAFVVGSNNDSTTFSGIIQDGGSSGGRHGSLTKIGTGSLTLNGANGYTGGTTVSAGTLQVTNTTGSATGTGTVVVAAGTLGGQGTISGAVTIGTGNGVGAGLAPSVGNNQPAILKLKKTLTFKADSTYSYKLNTDNARGDQVLAKRVSIESGAQFSFQPIGSRRLPAGRVFTLISNTSNSPITGKFSNLPDGSTFTFGSNSYQVSYEGGTGNDLTLTVVL
jgi:autotransporter-associated beta strand protein